MIESPDLKAMDIAKLRQYAAHYRIALAKTATKDDIVEAIQRKLGNKVAPLLADDSSKLKPGYAKIKLHSDPMPGASNLPVFLNCNMSTFLIPRDVEVIVPMRVIRTLNDAVSLVKKQALVSDQGGREVFKETTVKTISYPYSVIEMNPGPDVLNSFEMSKQTIMGPRVRYRDMFGHWPRAAELTRAIEQKLISLDDHETLAPEEERLISSSAILE